MQFSGNQHYLLKFKKKGKWSCLSFMGNRMINHFFAVSWTAFKNFWSKGKFLLISLISKAAIRMWIWNMKIINRLRLLDIENLHSLFSMMSRTIKNSKKLSKKSKELHQVINETTLTIFLISYSHFLSLLLNVFDIKYNDELLLLLSSSFVSQQDESRIWN